MHWSSGGPSAPPVRSNPLAHHMRNRPLSTKCRLFGVAVAARVAMPIRTSIVAPPPHTLGLHGMGVDAYLRR